MKIAIIGGGGFRVPIVYGALAERALSLGIEELSLYDVNGTNARRIAAVLEGIAAERAARGASSLQFSVTTELDAALDGANFVFCAIRVGRAEGRVIDERIPLNEGVVGQETTGPGGICFALRTVPVMLEIAQAVARHCPQAWFINFTNPAGIVTEAIGEVLGDRVLGICDSPTALCHRVAGAVGRPAEQLWFDYVGLNHLGWLRAVRDGERDLLPELLADDERLAQFEEGRIFGGEWLRTLGMIPNEYLYFYYCAAEAVSEVRSRLQTRAEQVVAQQRAFDQLVGETAPSAALASWRAVRREREGTYFGEARAADGIDTPAVEQIHLGGYEGEAIAVVEAISRDTGAVLIVNTPNRSSLPFLDDRAVVEVPALVRATGVVPFACGPVDSHAQALMTTIKDIERLTIRAAVTRSRALAVQAIALHPLVPSVTTARRIFDAYAAGHPELVGMVS
jgi:6-phospho-beta-glucosidase